jgi:hypothetical protein
MRYLYGHQISAGNAPTGVSIQPRSATAHFDPRARSRPCRCLRRQMPGPPAQLAAPRRYPARISSSADARQVSARCRHEIDGPGCLFRFIERRRPRRDRHAMRPLAANGIHGAPPLFVPMRDRAESMATGGSRLHRPTPRRVSGRSGPAPSTPAQGLPPCGDVRAIGRDPRTSGPMPYCANTPTACRTWAVSPCRHGELPSSTAAMKPGNSTCRTRTAGLAGMARRLHPGFLGPGKVCMRFGAL